MERNKREPTQELILQPTQETKKESQKSGTSKIIGFWSVAIPAYCYFFGYSSFKYQLQALGFDSPEIPTAPGDVYFHAFNTFAFIGSKILPVSKDLIIQNFNESNFLALCIAITLAVIAYFTQLILHRHKNKQTKAKEKNASDQTNWWAKGVLYFEKSKNWAWMILSGKGQSHSRWISKSIYLAAIVYISFFVMVPVILAVIAFFSLILMPPPVIGLKMAQDELARFNCPHNQNELKVNSECSAITLKDGKTFIGIIYSKDSKFMYFLTKDEAKTIAIDQIMQSDRKMKTGKPQIMYVDAGKKITESLYCHTEPSSFNSSHLLKQ